jgi:hypothetical protein
VCAEVKGNHARRGREERECVCVAEMVLGGEYMKERGEEVKREGGR